LAGQYAGPSFGAWITNYSPFCCGGPDQDVPFYHFYMNLIFLINCQFFEHLVSKFTFTT